MSKQMLILLAISVLGMNSTLSYASPTQSLNAATQTAACSGKVLDENGDPLIGASVTLEGTNQGANTDIDGVFQIGNVEIGAKISISFVGYKSLTITFTGQPILVNMIPNTNALDEVVVVAYGTQKKSSITGAISQVDAKEIELRPVSSVTSALEGTSSGITVTGSYGQPGSEPTIRIRGIGSVNGSNSPLIVVDGVPYGGNVSDLSPEEIASVSVLKDAASCALYGNRASNGVILITTKKSSEKHPTFTFKTNQGWYSRAIPEYDRVDINGFMNIEYQQIYNTYMSNSASATPQEGHDYVLSTLISNRFHTNPFGVSAEKLYNSDGTFTGAQMLSGFAEDTDWVDQTIRTGYRAEYLFSGAGGGDTHDYYFTVGYLDENGYMKNSGFSRLNGRAVVNIQPRRWLKTGLNIAGSHQKSNATKADVDGGNSGSVSNPFYVSRVMAPIYPVHLHNADGLYMLDDMGNRRYDPGYYLATNADGTVSEVPTRDQLSNNHCIWENELDSDRTIRNTFNSTAYFDIILPANLILSVKGNMNTINSENTEYNNPQVGSGSKGANGMLYKTTYNRKYWTLQQQIRWNYNFGGKYAINALAGHENYSMSYDYTYNKKQDVKVEGIPALSNFNSLSSISGYRTRYRTESYLARVQLGYDERYNLEGSFRRDGSSRFSKDHRWGNFGSVGANWLFSNESFMRDATWMDYGKLRFNWGQVGNDAGSGYYAYLDLYESDINGANAAYYIGQLGAHELNWETGESWGIGLETRLFNRWNLSVEYYDKRNKDLIFDVYNPISAGGTSTSAAESTITRNLGTMANYGFEINTDFDIFTNKDWTINLAANLTTLTNKIKKLPEQNKDGIISSLYKIEEGRSRYEYYTYHWAGVDMLDGNSLYDANLTDYHIVDATGKVIGGTYDSNGNLLSTEIAPADYKMINGEVYVNNTSFAKKDYRGATLPKVYGSFTPTIHWKGLSVSALFTYSFGGKIYDNPYSILMSTSASHTHHYHADLTNYWTGAPAGMTETSADRINPGINPRIDNSNSYNTTTSDRWLIPRNYFAMKNLNVSYRIPSSMAKKMDVNGIQFGFAAENLFINAKRKGLNPLQSLSGGVYNSMPPARVYTFSLQVTL